MPPWIYRGQPFSLPDDFDVKSLAGFVYVITNLTTGKAYIGKKGFSFGKRKSVKGKKKKFRVQSDWQDYFGSSESLRADVEKFGVSAFSREIIHLCTHKAHMSFWETHEIFTREALTSPNFYNEWVSCKIRKAHLTALPK